MNNDNPTAGTPVAKPPKAGDCAIAAGICFTLALVAWSVHVNGFAITGAILLAGIGAIFAVFALAIRAAAPKPTDRSAKSHKLTPRPSWDADNSGIGG